VPGNPEHEWGFTARGGASSPEIEVPRAKVLGGCSAHNATVAMRARPSDIRDWQEQGVDDWTVAEVMAAYKEMENTPDGDDAVHGRTGPFPVRHLNYDDLTTSLRAFIDAAGVFTDRGFQRTESDRRRRVPGQRHRQCAAEHRPGLSDRGGSQPAQPEDLGRCTRRSRLVRRVPGDRRRHGERRRDPRG
jgi:choline dehydrogenase-like flavoprotein